MGRSPTVQEMEQKEEVVRDYLAKLESKMETSLTSKVAEMQTAIDDFYKKNAWDSQSFLSGKNTDFMQKSEWSMSNVKKIIEAISKAVFGDEVPPDGVTIKKAGEVSKALSEMEGMELYIVNKTFQVLAGIVESFGSSSLTSLQSSYRDEPLGNGFHLFATIGCDVYKSSDFFNNEEIYEYLYVYSIRFSPDEAKAQAQITLTKLYEDQIAVFVDKVEALLQLLEDGKFTPEQYQEQVAIYNTLIASAKLMLDQLGHNATRLMRI